MTKFRKESDSMGEVEVPSDALYGAQTQRAIDNFDYSSRKMPKAFLKALAHVKKAAARANGELTCIDDTTAQRIISACDKLLSDSELIDNAFPVSVFQTGSGTSSNMNMNEVIAHLANNDSSQDAVIHPNDHVNYGQSSNDVVPTSLQLSVLLSIVEKLFPAIENVDKQLERLSHQYASVIKTGRTHLMDAMPMALGDEFETWRHQISESRERIINSLGRLSEIPLGGTAIGTGINRHKDFPEKVSEYLAEQTHLPIKPCRNLASRISAQDPTLEIHGQLKVLATALMKIANDIRWMNSGPNCGLSEIQLQALQPGSSIMPGKVNPVIAESIAMMAAEVMGNDTTLTIANQSGNFQLNVMLPLIADKSNESIDLLSHSLNALAKKLLVGFNVNEKQLSQQLGQNSILATALNTKVGYEKAAEIAKQSQKEGRSVYDIAKEKTDLDDETLKQLLDPEKLARPFD